MQLVLDVPFLQLGEEAGIEEALCTLDLQLMVGDVEAPPAGHKVHRRGPPDWGGCVGGQDVDEINLVTLPAAVSGYTSAFHLMAEMTSSLRINAWPKRGFHCNLKIGNTHRIRSSIAIWNA